MARSHVLDILDHIAYRRAKEGFCFLLDLFLMEGNSIQEMPTQMLFQNFAWLNPFAHSMQRSEILRETGELFCI